jgi:hypothetical protein
MSTGIVEREWYRRDGLWAWRLAPKQENDYCDIAHILPRGRTSNAEAWELRDDVRASGVTQKDIAKRCKIEASDMSRFMCGYTDYTADIRQRIRRALLEALEVKAERDTDCTVDSLKGTP